VATLALAGEKESGDLHLVKQVGVACSSRGGRAGHGAEAAAAARAAVTALDRYAEESLPPLVRRCHEALAGSRGVVMSLAYLGGVQPSLTWLGVGNVEGLVLYAAPNRRPARASLVTRAASSGAPSSRRCGPMWCRWRRGPPHLRYRRHPRRILRGLPTDATPQQLADEILARYGKGTDDALVLVARYAGGGQVRA